MNLSAPKVDTNQIAIDANALSALRQRAGQDPKSALRATAQQFETLFMNMLMKSMRDTIPKDGLFQSSANDMYTGMLDQQLAQKMSARGTGIADMIVKQLSQHMKSGEGGAATGTEATIAGGGAQAKSDGAFLRTSTKSSMRDAREPTAQKLSPLDATVAQRMRAESTTVSGRVIRFDDSEALSARLSGVAAAVASTAPTARGAAASVPAQEAPRTFMRQMSRHAEAAERVTGVPAKFMMGQAALESGWGRREIMHADGRTSHNLFGIKAGSSWTGKTVSVTTTEYIGGVAKKVVEKFRAYGSYAESFRDYASLIAGNPRYQDVLKRGGTIEGFANAMQRAGYATDPRYAEKLSRTINHIVALKRHDAAAATASTENAARSSARNQNLTQVNSAPNTTGRLPQLASALTPNAQIPNTQMSNVSAATAASIARGDI
jgi:peptidoglycan hydrolase FlgJ